MSERTKLTLVYELTYQRVDYEDFYTLWARACTEFFPGPVLALKVASLSVYSMDDGQTPTHAASLDSLWLPHTELADPFEYGYDPKAPYHPDTLEAIRGKLLRLYDDAVHNWLDCRLEPDT